ncbi:MAG: diguanylate cyclase [Defluviitaleaceae bacterium]|nr:diguanylate cyclase [Defluviitaleaceae bacterium]
MFNLETETKNITILVIDDSKSNIIALTHILKDNYNVLATKSGKTGISIAIDQKPDIILLDIIMPEIDGYEVLKELKNNNATRHIPVIFISGLNTEEDEEKGLILGAVDYIAKPFSATIVNLRINNQIRMLKQMETIERLSKTDILTNLPNRAAIEDVLKIAWERSRQNLSPLTILMIDIDNFKSLNDTKGHIYGDRVLKYISGVLNSSLKRDLDFVGRWGGEEFIAVLENSDLDCGIMVSEKIKENLKLFKRRKSDSFIEEDITVSVGIFTGTAGPNLFIEEFVDKADQALYIAKRTGKNKYVVYEENKSGI